MTTGAGSVDLGSAYGSLAVDFSGVERAWQSAVGTMDSLISGSITSMGQRLESLGGSISGFGTKLTAQLSPISAFVGGGILAFSNFDAVLTEIEARTGATGEQLDLVRQKSLQMGQDTKFSASEAAQGILELLASGMSLDEAFTAIGPVLDAAAASNMGLGQTAAAVSTILSQFKLPASEAARVANALAQAAAASRAEMGDLAAGFNNVGPIASEFGLSVEQTAAILGVFANKGIMGAEAGTQLKSMLTNMMRPTEDVQGMWEQLGVSMFDAQGNMRDINDVIADLNVAMDGMSDQERLTAINTLAGSYGQMGLSALLAEGGVTKMMTKMSQQATASEVAKKKMESFKGIVDTLMSTMETFSINVLGPMVEKYLEPLAKQVTELINGWAEWAGRNPEVAAKLGLVLAVLAVLGPALVALGGIISLIGTAFTGIGLAIGFILSPLGLLIALIVALGVAYATNFLGFKDFVDNLLPLLKAGFEELINIFHRLKTAFEQGGLSGLFEQLKAEVANAWPIILSLVQTGIDLLVGLIKEYGPQILAGLASGLLTISTWTRENILDPIWNALKDPANWAAVASFLLDVLNFIGSAEIAIGTWVNDHILSPLWGELTKQENWQKVGSFLSDVLAFIASAAVDFAGWVNTHVLAPLWEQVSNPQNWIKIGNFILDVLAYIGSAVVDFATWANEHILTPIWNAVNDNKNWFAVGEFLGQVAGFIASHMTDWVTWVKANILDPIWNAVTDKENWTAIYTFIKDAIDYIATNAPDWLKWVNDNLLQPMISAINLLIHNVGTAVVDGIKQGINDAWSGLTSWFAGKATSLIGGFMNGIRAHSPSQLFADAAALIPEGIALGINNNMQTALDALTGMTDQLGTLAPGAITPALAPAAAGMGGNQTISQTFQINIPMPDTKDPVEFGKQATDTIMDEVRKRGRGIVRA